MKKMRLSVWIVFQLAVICESCLADVKEIAFFKSPGRGCQIKWVALSADGSRLAASVDDATAFNAGGTAVRFSGGISFSNTENGEQIWAKKVPKSSFSYLMFSSDDRVILTVDGGQDDLNDYQRNYTGYCQAGLRTASKIGYQTWDSATGTEIGSNIAPPPLAEFSTAALSPDGKYLAAIVNAYGEPLRNEYETHYRDRALAVWDVAQHQVKWSQQGIDYQGRMTWIESLAFSPDGSKLLSCWSGTRGGKVKPKTDNTDPATATFARMRELTLDPSSNSPRVKVLKDATFRLGRLDWCPATNTLLVWDTRMFETLDPLTGKSTASFTLNYPPPPGRKPTGDSSLQKDLPDNNYETQTALSASGNRLASFIIRNFPRRQIRDNRVLIWDLATQKPLGTVLLGTEKSPNITQIDGTAYRISLSGDGNKLAVSDSGGAIHVYDVSELSGNVTPTPAETDKL